METPSQDLMQCWKCKDTNPALGWTVATLKGKTNLCKSCQLAYDRKYRAEHREAHYAKQLKWYKKNIVEISARNVANRKLKITSFTAEQLVVFRNKENDKAKRLYQVVKEKVFAAYGGYKCACCSETERSFLSIDHMLNNAYELKKTGVHGVGAQFYRWLVRNNFPPTFQVLCMNCQFGRKLNNGICPHQRKV